MDEGKKLLSSIIEDRLSKLSKITYDDMMIDNINIKDLLTSINEDVNNFYEVTDSMINEVANLASVKDIDTFKINVRSARDLLIGKKEYNLNVRLTQEHTEAINAFKKILDKKIKSLNPDVLDKDKYESRLFELQKQVNSNFLINDLEIVNQVVHDYDSANYDKNMLVIMKYINDLNINLIKAKKRNAPIFDIQMIRRPKMDPIIKDILKRLDIKTKEIPNILLSELKKCNAEEVEQTYKLVKKNKAENGGILHFIEKDNIVGRLVLLLFATEESISNVVNSLKDENDIVNIPLLKLIVNKIPSVFLCKTNTYYQSKYYDYMNNLELLKSNNVNYVTLIKRNPIFMLIDHKTLDYTIDYLSKLGANKKDVINRCYKTLSINPSLLIDNIEIMKKHNINLADFFNENNTNYNLLKMGSLDKKLNVIKIISSVDLSNIDELNKFIIAKVYKESKTGYINWGELK